MWKWWIDRRAKGGEAEAGRAAAAKEPDERLGPDPAPAPTGNRPGVEIHPAVAGSTASPTPEAAGQEVPGAAVSRLAPAGATMPGGARCWAAVVLSGEARGDVVFASEGPFDLPEGTLLLLDGLPGEEAGAPRRIPGDALTGKGVAGIAGARVLARTDGRSVLRLGPPPAARWAVVGLRSVAVLAGKLTLFDGDEGRDVWAGHVAFVADPSAVLHVQAGNDTAVAIAFCLPDVLVRLG